ncbi:SGNH/GDSL hydrolase family protein [Gammaproteobacteria bacterium]|nr:SGNH/GDSL hydrolase family protein [Gammaproteobacteria bacterium]
MKHLRVTTILVGLVFFGVARAELPWQFEHHTRYMALGDSLTAGYGAIPATNGYVYLLYQGGAFDTVPNTLLSNIGVPGATSQAVMDHQVPLAVEVFKPGVITLTVGGNDLLAILSGVDPNNVIPAFGANLGQILQTLCVGLPSVEIYVSNLYTVPLPDVTQVDAVVSTFNAVVSQVIQATVWGGCNVKLADVYNAFLDRKGLLLINRNQAKLFEVHPTNAGYRVMAGVFMQAIESN